VRNALVTLILVAQIILLTGCADRMTGVQPAQVVLNGPASIAVGGQAQFSVLVTDQNGAVLSGVSVEWGTDNPAVGTVDEHGLLTAVAAGAAAVTARTGGVTGSASFHVVAPLSFCKEDDHLDGWCRLTDSPTGQTFPSVSGARVVWADRRAPGSQVIMLLDLATGDTTSLTPEGEESVLPTIDGDRVIYARLPLTGDWQLLTYDLTTGVETTFSAIDRNIGLGRLALSGHRAAWHTNRDDNWDIYVFDFNTHQEIRLTTDPSDQADPAIFGDRVTWEDRRHSGSWWDLYSYDFKTGITTRVTQATTLGRASAVSADRIVWGDTRGGLFGLYEYDFSRSDHERKLSTTPLENSLTMSLSRVAWEDAAGDIHAFDITTNTEVPVTNLASSQRLPWISQDYLVWEDYRNGHADIYIARLVDVFEP
jgi:beta propeller repeat protein